MEIEIYKRSLPVKLSEDEIRNRERLQAQGPLAIQAANEALESATEDWKARKKILEAAPKAVLSRLIVEAKILKTGEEDRDVDCRDELHGNQVVTYRCDTDVEVNRRPAHKNDRDDWDDAHPPMVPGGGSTVAKAAKALKDHLDKTGTTMTITLPGDASGDIAALLLHELAAICAEPKGKAFVLAALKKAVPASSPIDREAAVKLALEKGYLGELAEGHPHAGKLQWAPSEPDEVPARTEQAAPVH